MQLASVLENFLGGGQGRGWAASALIRLESRGSDHRTPQLRVGPLNLCELWARGTGWLKAKRRQLILHFRSAHCGHDRGIEARDGFGRRLGGCIDAIPPLSANAITSL